jgi:hypothetical protein
MTFVATAPATLEWILPAASVGVPPLSYYHIHLHHYCLTEMQLWLTRAATTAAYAPGLKPGMNAKMLKTKRLCLDLGTKHLN